MMLSSVQELMRPYIRGGIKIALFQGKSKRKKRAEGKGHR